MRARTIAVAATLAFVFAIAANASAQGQIIVDFFAAPGTGFADPTPAAPVGGNPGTTVGQQRIYVFLQAAAIWTDIIKPEQDIFMAAQFQSLPAGVLGSAGAQFIHANFPGAELPNTWHFDSLADHIAQGDLAPCCYDIVARFSTNFVFYLGLDNNEAPGQADLLVTVLHEMGHGLNFANAVDETTGAIPTPAGATEPFGDIYSQYTQDVTTGKTWNAMSAAERAASAINVRKVSWNGLHVELAKHKVLKKGEPGVRMLTPPSTSPLMLGEAAFGPPLTAAGVTGNVVLADSSGTTTGCTAISSNVSGKIALIDRGVCAFTVKVKNAQDAGAIGVLIGDNVLALPPPGLGGVDATITIPSGRIGLPDANAIKTSLASGPVRVKMHVDNTILAGTDRVRRQVLVAALNPVAPGSSISHFDTAAKPNQIMEPAINSDLVTSVEPPQDLTFPLLTDLGWLTDRDGVPDGRDFCLGSILTPTVVGPACDSMVPNTIGANGCSISDYMAACDQLESNSLARVCKLLAAVVLKGQGVITGQQLGAINSCMR
ncbi:MAG: peptidase [Cyanobacteria bacterium]|nr:peptidase [Cyanobacteriota bacterium]